MDCHLALYVSLLANKVFFEMTAALNSGLLAMSWGREQSRGECLRSEWCGGVPVGWGRREGGRVESEVE